MSRIDENENDGETAAKCLLWLSLILTVIFFAGLMWIGYECFNDSIESKSQPDEQCWDCINGRLNSVDRDAAASVTASGDRVIQ